MRYGPPFRYAYREDGRRVAYQVVGEGDLDLVFLFGWPTHLGLMWENPSSASFLRRLSSFSRLLLYDPVSAAVTFGSHPATLVVRWWRMLYLSAASPAETYEGIRSLGPVDIRGLLGSVQAPVLVLHRTGDRVADIVDSTRLAADMGDRRWHQVLVEHQEVVRQQLVGLLGDDIGGIAVHIAARVMAAAGAGEIVCSRTVKDLVAGAGYAFADRGTRTLKGVPDSWQLYAVELAER
jgi:pimeloyl-ACP methyl ester carboxylesterase